jgi:hypothetical protein
MGMQQKHVMLFVTLERSKKREGLKAKRKKEQKRNKERKRR